MATPRPCHADIARALRQLGERSGRAEVAAALREEWEPFEAQMRRRMRTRPSANRDSYRVLARAGAEKVRFHLQEIGALPAAGAAHRSRGAVIRLRWRPHRHLRRFDREEDHLDRSPMPQRGGSKTLVPPGARRR